MDNNKKINIESTEPINKIADVERVCDAFEERGGYITLEEDMNIRKRISSRNHLAVWISYVKNKLVYRKEKIVSQIVEARDSIKGKVSSKKVSSSIAKPLSKVNTYSLYSYFKNSSSLIGEVSKLFIPAASRTLILRS